MAEHRKLSMRYLELVEDGHIKFLIQATELQIIIYLTG